MSIISHQSLSIEAEPKSSLVQSDLSNSLLSTQPLDTSRVVAYSSASSLRSFVKTSCAYKYLMKLSLKAVVRKAPDTEHRKNARKHVNDGLPFDIQSLPPEILIQILGHVADGDRLGQKSLRFVCRQWAEASAIKLFDTLVVSPSDININAFKNVTSHPKYARYVKCLIYDASCFRSDLTTVVKYQKALLGDDRELEHTGADVDTAKRRAMKFLTLYSGQKRYQRQSEEQIRYLTSSGYQDVLVKGIQKLSSLREVDYRTYWEQPCTHSTCHNEERGPGALARAWKYHYLRPRGSQLKLDRPETRWQFADLALAFQTAGRTVEKFTYSESWVEGTFEVPFHLLPPKEVKAIVSFLKPLRHLDVALGWDSSYFLSEDDSVRREVFLNSAANLEILTLHRWNFPRIVGTNGFAWKNLRDFHYPASSATESQLISFVRVHKSTLRHLCFASGAFFGHWANVLDAMREHLTLESFNFAGLPTEYLDIAGSREKYELTVDPWANHGAVTCATHDLTSWAIEDFVMNGGENPLRSDGLAIRRSGEQEFLDEEGKKRVMDADPADPW